MTFGGGETIKLSFGPSAGAVTSHLCNLEGLACTAPSSYPDDGGGDAGAQHAPLCDPNVTHSVGSDGLHVPRVLFVDGMDAFAANPWTRSAATSPAVVAASAATPAAVHHHRSDDTKTDTGVKPSSRQEDVVLSAAFDTLNVCRAEDDPRVPSRSGSAAAGAGVSTWSGPVDVHHRSTGRSGGAASQRDPQQQGMGMIDPMAMFHQTAVNLTTSAKSRYRAGTSNAAHSSRFVYPPSSSSPSGGDGGSGGRHMVWDSDEEEEGDGDDGYGYANGRSEEDNEEMRRLQERREAQRWYGEERDQYDALVGAWGETSSHRHHPRRCSQSPEEKGAPNSGPEAAASGDHGTTSTPENMEQEQSSKSPSAPDLAWVDYFMPPHPSVASYAAPLPFNTSLLGQEDRQRPMQQQAYLSSYHAGYHPSSSSGATMPGSGSSLSTSWREDVLSEKIRRLLEGCDAVRGFNVAVEGGGGGLLHGGLATSVLEELGDECRSAGRFCLAVDATDKREESRRPKLKASQFGRGVMSVAGDEMGGETKMIESFRSALNSGLALHGLSSNSDLFLPISLAKSAEALFGSDGYTVTPFQSSAAAALAIEASTLPYRLLGLRTSGSGTITPMRSKIGIQSGHSFAGSGQSGNNADPYATPECLSFHEFMHCVKPSNRHSVLSLDALITTLSGNGLSLNSALTQGTSIERRRLEAESNLHRGRHRYGGPQREVEPGLWLEDRHNYGGILSTFSPLPASGQASIRSNHSHFALSSTYRPAGSDPSSDPAAAYTTLLMEGMGIRYRPEVSVGTVVRQSIRGLTGNAGYAAGAYWKSILGSTGSNHEGQPSDVDAYVNTPILSVLGNSTRIYPHLNATSTNFAAALSRRYAGYMSRDAMAGLAPEAEDTAEAVEACYEMRDAYEPPLGSGLLDDDEGDYFSENED